MYNVHIFLIIIYIYILVFVLMHISDMKMNFVCQNVLLGEQYVLTGKAQFTGREKRINWVYIITHLVYY